jgi:hypothetical protein
MSPSQYTALTHSSSPFPIHGHFIESKRWGEGKKPKLFPGTAVSLGGFIDRIHRERDINRSVSQIEIEVVTVSFIPIQTHAAPDCTIISLFPLFISTHIPFDFIAP